MPEAKPLTRKQRLHAERVVARRENARIAEEERIAAIDPETVEGARPAPRAVVFLFVWRLKKHALLAQCAYIYNIIHDVYTPQRRRAHLRLIAGQFKLLDTASAAEAVMSANKWLKKTKKCTFPAGPLSTPPALYSRGCLGSHQILLTEYLLL